MLSGKGGTGKTLVSVNLAAAAKSTYIDCDVEEPNGHLFFRPEVVHQEDVAVRIPVVNAAMCSGCRKCTNFCKFHALAYARDKVLVFEEVCHSCGGCILLCPEKALKEKEKIIGSIQRGASGEVTAWSGVLNIGEASGVPIIRRLLESNAGNVQTTFIDCPPGSACIVMESIRDADYCILVAEPTIFGVHNLAMVYDLVTLFHKPCSVVLNKCLDQDNPAERYCTEHGIRILGSILYDDELGALHSNAQIALRESDRYRAFFSTLLNTVVGEAQNKTACHP